MKATDVICQVRTKKEKQKLEEYFAIADKLLPTFCGIFYFIIKVSPDEVGDVKK